MRQYLSSGILSVFIVLAVAGCVSNEGQEVDAAAPKKSFRGLEPAAYLDKLSKELYDKILRENVKVPSFDGKRMDNWVFRPEVPDGTKVPVFINFSPYWYNLAPGAENRGDNFAKYMIDYFVPRGYAVVLSSVRGTGHSEGCFNIGGEYEMRDAVAVIEHFAKQPWSNGNIAAGGKSYDGTTPQGAAIKAPEALKAIFPVSGISELYKYNYKGGIPYGNGASFNTYYYAGMSAAPSNAAFPPLFMADRVACPYLPEVQAHGVGSSITGDYTAYWQERNYTRHADKVTAALFFVHGFTDWNVKPDHILPWLSHIKAPMKAWLHNWTKSPEGGHVYPMREDWNLTMLRFLDQTLKGVETGIFDEPTYQIQDSNGKWRWEETWPPERAIPTKYYFSAKDGQTILDPAAPGTGAARAYLDQAGTLPGVGGAGGAQCTRTSGPALVRYESPVLEQAIHYAGVPVVNVQAKTDRPVGKIVATLCAVGPSGQFQMINWGGLNFRHRVALENPQPVVPDTLYSLRFPLFPQDDFVPAGWKLVLLIAGAGGQYSALPYQNTVTLVENDKAYLELPLITTFDYEDPQPLPIACFAC